MKKLLGMILIASLVMSAAMPVAAAASGASGISPYAASGSSTAISSVLPAEVRAVTIGGIEAILVDGNSDMALAKNTLDRTDQDYRNLKFDVSALEIKYEAVDLTAPGGWSQAASLSSQLTTMRSSLTSAKYNLDSAKLRYDQEVRQIVLAAQQQFISAAAAMAQSTISETNLVSQEKLLSSMKLKLEKGFISKKQYDVFATQVIDLRNALVDQKNQSLLQLEKLRVVLGLKEGTSVVPVPETVFDFSQIPVFDKDKDLQTMLDSSINIRTKMLSLESVNKAAAASYDHASYKYAVLDAELLLKQTIAQEKLNFQDQFINLQSSFNALTIQNKKLEDKKTALRTMALLQSYGFASIKQVEDLKTEVTNQELQIVLDQHKLYMLQNQYDAAKLGY